MFRVQSQHSYFNRDREFIENDVNGDRLVWTKRPNDIARGNVSFQAHEYIDLKPKHVIAVYGPDGNSTSYVVRGWMLKYARCQGSYWIVPYIKRSNLVPESER